VKEREGGNRSGYGTEMEGRDSTTCGNTEDVVEKCCQEKKAKRESAVECDLSS
jgi:hypothetical protein